MNMAALSALQPVGVVGAGAMGAGIAQVAAAAGHPVKLYDTRPDAAAQAIDGLRAQFDKLAAKGKLSDEQVATYGARLQAVVSMADLAGCDMVVEAIVERLDIKQALLRELEPLLSADAVIASNTSSAPVSWRT